MAANAAFAVTALAPRAHAQQALLTQTGEKGQLVFDNLTGLKANFGGVSYSGIVGFKIERYGVNEDLGGGATGTDVLHATTFWFAPEADYFVINHLSIGGLVEVASTSYSEDRPVNAAATQNVDLGSVTDITLLPRVGWMFALGDRWGIWPRGGIGFVSRHGQLLGGNGTFSGVVLDANCPFIFRINETFFLDLMPDVTWIPGSTSQTDNAGRSTSQSSSYVSFGAVGGLGVMLDL